MRAFRIIITLLFASLLWPGHSSAQLIEVTIAPPVLPVYEQPPIPGPGYIWTPGYWAYGPEAYYWVPGTWVLPPRVGLLWTPGYWGWRNGVYLWNAGYWGPQVGFYGGVAYGFGYTGVGYAGGYWSGGAFMYNRTVTNIGSVNITNVYSKTVVVNKTTNVSFNGGPQGIQAKPSAVELAAAKQPHVPATTAQTEHVKLASADKRLLASANNGRPPVAATTQPGVLQGKGVVAAHSAPAVANKPAASVTPGAKPQTSPAQQLPKAARANPVANPKLAPGLPKQTVAPKPPGQAGLNNPAAARVRPATMRQPAPPRQQFVRPPARPAVAQRAAPRPQGRQPPHPNR